MNNNTTNVIDWDRTRELNARRAREAMEDGSYVAGWVTVYKREPLELGGERLTADIKSYGTQLPLEDWLRLHMLDTPVVASEAPAIYAPSAEPTLMFAPGTTVTPELLSAAQALLTNEWAWLPSTHRAEFHRGAEGETLIIVDSLEPAPAEEAPLSSDAHEFAVKKGHSQAEAEAFAEFVDKFEGARDE